MKKITQYLIILTAGFYTGCNPSEKNNHGNIITVSILPQKYFTEKIAGSQYNINVMIPPGASPATYEPSPRQIRDLSNSDVYLRIGKIGFETAWIDKLEHNYPGIPFIDVSEGIDFITTMHVHDDHRHEGSDPHIWMSPKNTLKICNNIFRGLSGIFPHDSVLFRKNYKKLLLEINRVDSMFTSFSSGLEGKHFLIYHPALGYLARDYDMVQHVLELEGKEPPPSHIAEIIKEAELNNINYIFVQSQFSMDNAKSLAREINAEIIEINPLNEDWSAEMINILEYLTNQEL